MFTLRQAHGPKGPRPNDFDVLLDGKVVGTLYNRLNNAGKRHCLICRNLSGEIAIVPDEAHAFEWFARKFEEAVESEFATTVFVSPTLEELDGDTTLC